MSSSLPREPVTTARSQQLQCGYVGTLGGTYNIRHDSILSAITETVSRNIPQTTSMTADIGDTYEFPHHIILTDLRPDLVWWNEAHKSITLVELTVCFETNFEEAAQRKTAKYLYTPCGAGQG